jgi:hypothetical protein
MSDKAHAAHHPRTTPPWTCQTCGRNFPTDGLCALHEPRCPERVEAK